ncbi:MAG: hypothetical protein ACI4FZ_10930 [Lachnospiraceae bacterium]
MSKRTVKEAFDTLQPEAAKDRMYRNIQKKAANQRSSTDRIRMTVRKLAPVAACLLLLLGGGTVLLLNRNKTVVEEPPVLIGNPYYEIKQPEEFAEFGLPVLRVPETTKEASYYVISGETAEARFLAGDRTYTYSAAKTKSDFSGVYGEITESELLSANYEVLLETTKEGFWKASWSDGVYYYYLCNTDGATREEIEQIIASLLQ